MILKKNFDKKNFVCWKTKDRTCWSVLWGVKSVEGRFVLLLFDTEERWVLGSGFCNVVDGGFVFVFGLLWDLLSILSTANGDVESFGADEPIRSASLRKDAAGDFSGGSFVANCCCCCCLELLLDDVGEEVTRCDDDKSLFEEEWVWDFDVEFVDSFESFLYWGNKSIVRSITEEKFEVELRFVDDSDGETIDGFAIGRTISDLINDCSDN